jgi:hypothetical protein
MTVIEGHFGQPRAQGRVSNRERPDAGGALPVSIASHRAAKNMRAAIARFTNVMGDPHSDEVRQRLTDAATTEVTAESWKSWRTIVLNPRRTVWQALLEHTDYGVVPGPATVLVDAGFPPFQPAEYRAASDWETLPTTAGVREALLAEANVMRRRDAEE